MRRNWRLLPPETIHVENYDFDRDSYGNATAHYSLTWDDGKKPVPGQSGSHVTRPGGRVQVGYRDGISSGAVGLTIDLFPSAVFQVEPGSVNDHGHRRTCRLMRNHDRESVDVIFREAKDDGSLIAFFPAEPFTNSPDSLTIYERAWQHGGSHLDYYRQDTRPARDPEAVAQLSRQLENAGYRLNVKKRLTENHHETRAQIVAHQ